MLLVLDTNVLQADLQMRTTEFAILLDYLRKTQSRVVIPRIVLDELTANLGRDIRSRLNAYVRARGQLQGIVKEQLPESHIDVDAEVKSYVEALTMRLNVLDTEIGPYRAEHLPEVMRRAVNRVKPCNDKGEEIRDAVLWLTVLDIAEHADNRAIAFVSQNTKQFAGGESSLHEHLLRDTTERRVTVNYFTSLKNWAEKHASHITFVTKDWLSTQLPLDKALEATRGILESYAERYADDLLPSDERATGYFNLTSGIVEIESFYVYEMLDGSLRAEISLTGEAEIECEVEKTASRTEWDYGYEFDPLQGKYDYIPVPEERSYTDTAMTFIYPTAELTVDAIIRDRKVVEYKIVDGSLS